MTKINKTIKVTGVLFFLVLVIAACTKLERMIAPSSSPTVKSESDIEIIDPTALQRINENQVLPINTIQGESLYFTLQSKKYFGSFWGCYF